MKPVTLIITMYNQKDLLNICLKYLSEVKDIHNIIFIDNGSTDGTAQMLSSMPYDYISFDEGKQGYGTIWNACLDNFQLDEAVVFMNIQFLPAKNCLSLLSTAVLEDKIAIAGPKSNGFLGTQYIPISSNDAISWLDDIPVNQNEKNSYSTVVGLDAGIWAISREMMHKIGKFNEELTEYQSVLLDYELKIIQKDFCIAICNNAIAYDMYCGIDKLSFAKFSNKNDRAILKNIWKMNYFNRMPNTYIETMIDETACSDFNVLEIGCDLGATLLYIKSKHPNCKVHGIDINPATVNIAKHLADIKTGNIEEDEITFPEKFDYIIFADVLEHLRNPQKTIRYCKNHLLKSHGCILACIPNLMHISVMQQLLNGIFKYEDTGLLDRTHIHFFTYYEILSMFQEEGYTLEIITNSKVQLSEDQEQLKLKLLELSENVKPFMYETFQYLVRARSNT